MAKGLLVASKLHWIVSAMTTERRLAGASRELVYALIVQEVHAIPSYLVPMLMKELKRTELETNTHWVVPHWM